MTGKHDNTAQVLEILDGYKLGLINQGVKPKRFPLKKNFSEANNMEILGHAFYLINKAESSKKSSTYYNADLNQKLGAVQTLLAFTGSCSILDTMYDLKRAKQ